MRLGVPVLMYHGVGPDKPGWPWNYLMTPLAVFEAQMKALRDHGWQSISLRELYDHLEDGRSLPDRCLVLTFDDGYLDNWVYAWPILQRYGQRAVVYVSMDFIDPSSDLRPTLKEVWDGRCNETDLPSSGFLSAVEMRRMIESGHIEIQSHAKTHTWYPKNSTVVDFHRPQGIEGYAAPLWLGWNRHPDRKWSYMGEDLSHDVPLGTPIYETVKSLAGERFFPSEHLAARLTQYVENRGGAEFFGQSSWRAALQSVVQTFSGDRGRVETEAEYLERVREELGASRAHLHELTGQPVEFFCWPGGGRNARTLPIAEEVGYLATTTHYSDRQRLNVFGQAPSETNRIGSGSPWTFRGRTYKNTGSDLFLGLVESFAGISVATARARLAKLKYFT